MADAEAAAPMATEPDDFVEPEEPLEDLPQVSLDIFNVVKTSHAQHGLRHGDYLRYRQYCARRLHRIRKAAGLTHGKGRFVKKPLEPRMIREGKHLMLALYCSERAWSYAMQLKRENTAGEPRPKYHAMHRLRKAAKWSATLSQLCSVRSDKRTALEADAYCGFMTGNMHLEREEWGAALQQLKRTRTICAELSKVSMAEQVHLYKQMVEEVEPSIRFCEYNLRRDGEGAEEGGEEGMDALLDTAEGASDILRAKLESVLNESRAKAAEHLNEMDVLGERVPIKSEKTRICIIRANQTLAEIEQAGGDSSELGMSQYDNLFVAFNDALECVRADLRSIANDKAAAAGVARGHLQKLQTGLTWQKHNHTVARTQLLVQGFKEAIGAQASGGAGKKVTPDDIVRLYDAITGSLGEMSQLDGYKEDEALMGQVLARLSAAKALRCFWVAESYGAVSKWKEAQALYERTSALLYEAMELLEGSGYAAELPAMRSLETDVEGAKARAHAQGILVGLQGEPAVAGSTAEVAQMSLGANKRQKPLLESLHSFERPNVDELIAFPPKFETVPCKPLLFDIARNAIGYPDLSARAAAKRSWLGGALGSSWFGR